MKETVQFHCVSVLSALSVLLILMTLVCSGQANNLEEPEKTVGAGTNLSPHSPIHIKGNGEFTSVNGVVSGSGTQSDPYVIEGWEIDANGGTYCIWIENTSSYFAVRNCTLKNTTATSESPYGCGILLTNLTNGSVDSNNVSACYISLGVGNSEKISITANTISSSSYAVIIRDSTNCTLYGNTIKSNVYGVRLDTSANNTVEKNLVTGNGAWGILLYQTCDTQVMDNNVSDTVLQGIWLCGSNNNTILYNTIINNTGYGVYIEENSTGNQVLYNNFINNNGAGKGVSGKCQAYDDAGNNSWSFSFGTIKGGNYWSNWDGNGWGTQSAYPIDGGAGASDWYPLSGPVSETSTFPIHLLAAITLLFIPRLLPGRRSHHSIA
ncbi:MAG: right-handed parallel beta-helix repeat-containing protein [Thermoplasmata archaeon]|nr:right-handed parallel beta-helix repeat-containing protein [Thermoplasmata archaeon]